MSDPGDILTRDQFLVLAVSCVTAARNSLDKAVREWDSFRKDALKSDSFHVNMFQEGIVPSLYRKVMLIRSKHSYRDVFGKLRQQSEGIQPAFSDFNINVADVKRCFIVLFIVLSINKKLENISFEKIFSILRAANKCSYGRVDGKSIPFINFVAKVTRSVGIVEWAANSSRNTFVAGSWDHVAKEEVYFAIKFHRSPLESIIRSIGGLKCQMVNSRGSSSIMEIFFLIKIILDSEDKKWNEGWRILTPNVVDLESDEEDSF